jgi:hypothetical protein
MDILTRNMQHLGASERPSDRAWNEELVALAHLKWFPTYGAAGFPGWTSKFGRVWKPKVGATMSHRL